MDKTEYRKSHFFVPLEKPMFEAMQEHADEIGATPISLARHWIKKGLQSVGKLPEKTTESEGK